MPFQVRDYDFSLHGSVEEAVPRFVINEDGILIHASSSLKALYPEFSDVGQDVSDILTFKAKGVRSFRNVRSGVQDIVIGPDGAAVSFRFDWVETADEKKYLVASLEDEMAEHPPAALEDFVSRVEAGRVGGFDLSPEKFLGYEALGSLERGDDLAHFAQMSRDAMIVIDSSGNLIRANKAFMVLFGYKASEIEDLNFTALFPVNERPLVRSSLQALSLQDDNGRDTIIDFEAQVTTGGGQTRWMEWHQHRKGDFIYCTGHDITASKNHEVALNRREQQLLEAESIGRMGHWRWVMGEDKIEWSDQIYRIMGQSRESFSPSIEALYKLVHRRDVGHVVQAFQRAIIEQNNYDMEFRVLRPDGEIRYIQCEGRCELDHEGEVVALFGIMHDMTERILYEQNLREAKEAAERAYSAKSQFLANMSHELRTPLNAILGFSEMIQRQLLGPVGTEKYLDYVAGIHDSGQHLLDLISDILDMSKIEAGKYELDLEEVNVHKVLCMALHMMEGRAQEAGVSIAIEVPPDDEMTIVADRRALLQIMLNLMSNAVKFTRGGGKVWVECHTHENGIAIKVCDTGIGIPANKLQTITRPFEQALSSYTRDHDGSGLGLAITKDLVELHGGALLIDSTVNVGTVATVRLPFEAKAVV